MGLLDFFNKGGNTNPQSDNTNPPAVPDFAGIQQSYTNQSLANVSYPMASSNPYAPTAPVAPIANPAQDVNTQINAAPAQLTISPMPSIDAAQPAQVELTQPMPQVSVQPELPVGEYVDPSKHPVIPEVVPEQGHTETMPEGIKVTTFESNGAVPYNPPAPEQSVRQMEQLPEVIQEPVSEPKLEQPQEVTPELTPVTQTYQPQEVVQDEPLTTGFMPITNSLDQSQTTEAPVKDMMDMSQNTMPVENQMPTMEPVTELNNLSETNTLVPAPEMTQVSEVLEQPQAGLDTTPGMPEVQIEGVMPVAPVVVTPEPIVDINNTGLEIGVGLEGANGTDVTPSTDVAVEQLPEVAQETGPSIESNLNTDIVVPTVESTPEVVTESVTEIAMPEAQVESPAEAALNMDTPITEIKESQSENEPIVQNVAFEMSYFKTVGFIGLNTQQTNSKVEEKISELSKNLAEHAEVFILDSAKGYAKSIYDNAKEKQIELMGMFLKPFHSGYSDEAELGDYDDFTVMMFSNSGDKIKNIIKESELLIMPEVTGLNNISTLFDIWSTNSMYPGQNKPLLLVGKGWTNILTQLKSLFKLTDADLAFVTVCQTTEEALAKITELDKEFITKEVKQPRKVIDLREEDDEEGLFV